MEKTITYQLFENIDIGRFESEYKDILRRVAKGDRDIANKRYSGLMAACDKLYEVDNRERWKADYMYLGIMQAVLENVVAGTPIEKEVCYFLRSINTGHVRKLFELLEEDMEQPEDSEEVSEFELYCMEIDMLPITDFAFAYEETRFFLHKDVELKPSVFLGAIVQSVHVLSHIMLHSNFGIVTSHVIVQDSIMYGEFFERGKAEIEREKDLQNMGLDVEEPESRSAGNERKIDPATLRMIEQAQREQQARARYEDNGIGAKIKGFCRKWNAIITKWFGKAVVPLFWIALILLYIGDFGIAIITTLVLYFIGKLIKV